MEIKQDERAMLQLLLERGQSYGDIAGLLGQSEADVRARARALLTRLGGADPDAEVGMTDYLLGQADPIGRADAVRHLQRDAAAKELAREIATKLQAIAPSAELPDLDGSKPRRRAATIVPGAGPAEGAPAAPSEAAPLRPRPAPGSGLDRRQQRLIALIGSAALILLIAILAIAGAFSGDDDAASGATGAAGDLGVTQVPLQPRGGSSATGEAIFGQTEEDFPYVDLNITGLPPAGEGEQYFLWLLFIEDDDQVGVPFSTLALDQNGNLGDRLAFPNALIPFAALATHIDVSRSSTARVAEVTQALNEVNQELPFIPYVGESVLRGRIPALSDEDLEELGLGEGTGGLGGAGQGSGQGGGAGGAGGSR